MSLNTPSTSPEFFEQHFWPFGAFRQGEERVFHVPYEMAVEHDPDVDPDDLPYEDQPSSLYLFRVSAKDLGLPSKPIKQKDERGFTKLQKSDLTPWQIMVQKGFLGTQIPKVSIEPAVTRRYLDWYCLPEVIVLSSLPKLHLKERDTYSVWHGSVRRYDSCLDREAEDLQGLREDDSVHFVKSRKGLCMYEDFLTVSDARKKIQELLLYNSDEYPFDSRESVSFRQATYERLSRDVRMKKNEAAVRFIVEDGYRRGVEMRDALPMIEGLEEDEQYADRVNFLYRFLNESPQLQEAFPEVKKIMKPFHTFDESAKLFVLDFVKDELPDAIDEAIDQVSQELDLEGGQQDPKEISTRVFQKIRQLPEMISILLQMEAEYLRSELIGFILEQFSFMEVGPVPDLGKYIGRYLLDEGIRFHRKTAKSIYVY